MIITLTDIPERIARNPTTTRADLDGANCVVPDCMHPKGQELYLHAECHPTSPLRVAYLDGKLLVFCDCCDGTVAIIGVAP